MFVFCLRISTAASQAGCCCAESPMSWVSPRTHCCLNELNAVELVVIVAEVEFSVGFNTAAGARRQDQAVEQKAALNTF